MVPTEPMSPVERKILAAADPQGRLAAFTKQAEHFLTHADAKEILHTDQRKKVILGLKKMLTPERADELRTIAEHYQQKLRDYQKLSRTDPILACCRIVVPDCERTECGVVGRTDDGVTFGLMTNGRPLFGNSCPPQVLQKIVEMQEMVVQLGAASYDTHGCFVHDGMTPEVEEFRGAGDRLY